MLSKIMCKIIANYIQIMHTIFSALHYRLLECLSKQIVKLMHTSEVIIQSAKVYNKLLQ